PVVLPLVALAAVVLPPGAVPARPARPLPARSQVTPPRTPQTMRYAPGEVLVMVGEPGTLAADAHGRPVAADARLVRALERQAITRAERFGAGTAAAPSRLMRLSSDRPDFDPV